MSIRIYTLAKELKVSSKELAAFINERFDKYRLSVKPSSTVASFLATDISDDFKAATGDQNGEVAASAAAGSPEKDSKTVKDEKAKATRTPSAQAKGKKTEGKSKTSVGEHTQGEEKTSAPRAKSAPILPPMPKAPSRVVPPAKPPVIPGSAQAGVSSDKPPSLDVPKIPARPKISMPEVSNIRRTENSESKQPEVVVRTNAVKPPSPLRPGFASISRPPMNAVPPPIKTAPKIPGAVVPPPVSKGDQQISEENPTQRKNIQVKPPIIVRDFARLMGLKPFRLISELMDMGIFASMNQSIEESLAVKIAERHGFELDIRRRDEQQHQLEANRRKEMARKIVDDIKNYVPRPPIVCVLGHVDHGKTTLLDTIRNTNVVAGEAGGITQHTAAYQVEHSGKKITFLDTPGHAAFSKMRERGANVTDIAILVVAADDGFMPQTDEALNFAQKAGVPVVVAINKMDAKGANVDRVKQQMQKRGITSEDWGGETLCTPISALKGENIDKLLELVLLQAEMMELKANPKSQTEGIILESQIEPGRGATSTVIVRSGTLKTGDILVSGECWCKVRALLNDKGSKFDNATPSTSAVVMGWTAAPEAGDNFVKVENDRVARRMVDEAAVERKKRIAHDVAPKPASLEDLMAAIESKDHKVFKCMVKSDVSGTVEALCECLGNIKSDKVKLEIIGSGVGQITKKDVDFAATVDASIVGFNVKQENGVAGEAKHKGVRFITHNIIYELIDQVRDAMKDLLDPELRENKLGAAEVRALFNISKGGRVAGCMVTEGTVKRDKLARVWRGGNELAKGRIAAIKRFKDDVSEVRAGYECGILFSNFDEFEQGDTIECYEILEIRPDL